MGFTPPAFFAFRYTVNSSYDYRHHWTVKSIAVLLLVFGGLLFTAGILLLFIDKIPWLGHLPGDIHFKFKNVQVHLPIMSCLLLSLVLTILLNIILRLFGK